ncbi:MAG: PilZ domain-containing protein [Candidatus Omnitrophica bacterium]|nr:PilZ domain-containing protein [Candidatus Omnitrophota bacterium]
MTYYGPERRKHPRIGGRFIVSYRIVKDFANIDTSQTKNLSQGGMLLTTNRKFSPDTILALEIRLPFAQDSIRVNGKVLQSHEVTKDLIYDTRIMFLKIKEKQKKVLERTVDYYLKKG